MKTEILTLNENINLESSSGYFGHLDEAVIDVKKGTVVSDKPVDVKMLSGSLNAQHLEITDNGSVLRFNDVHYDLLMPGKVTTKTVRTIKQRRAINESGTGKNFALCWSRRPRRDGGFGRNPSSPSQAPNTNTAPGPFQGMMNDQKKDQPVQIEAATLEVRDKEKVATFAGDVHLVQGDTIMKCQSLVVFYGQEVGIAGNDKAAPAPAPVTTSKSTPGMPQGAQNIRRIEARGGVTVITKDQNASGDTGIYDLTTKTITLSGNVTVSQGQNVIHGERVVVDTATGNARVESASTPGVAAAGVPGPPRVRALIQPGKGQGGASSNIMTIGPSQGN